jgi:carbonic anhydrase
MKSNSNRARFTPLLSLLLVLGLIGIQAAEQAAAAKSSEPAPAATAIHSSTPGSGPTPDQALQKLIDGNKRFVQNSLIHPNQTGARRTEVAGGQHPFAIILACSDSRVAPEILFDQGMGDLFVVRVAGNVLNDNGIGSIEYAVEHLHASLIVVMGHAKCGAVTAAVAGGHAPGRIQSLVESLEPAVKAVEGAAGDKVVAATKANVERGVRILKGVPPILGEAVSAGKVKVVGAVYDITTGAVEVIP